MNNNGKIIYFLTLKIMFGNYRRKNIFKMNTTKIKNLYKSFIKYTIKMYYICLERDKDDEIHK